MKVFNVSRTRRAIAGVISVAVCVGAVGIAQQQPISAAPGGYQEYVALGDSWSAATAFVPLPTTEHVPIDCAQQAYNYPHQVAAALAIPVFHDATCGSATTFHMTNAQALPLGGVNPPQFDRLTPTTDLVTFGIGGNDIGLAVSVLDCISLLPFNIDLRCKNAMDRAISLIPQTEQAIVNAVAGIRQRSPNAQIFLVNYLDAVPIRGCWPIVPFTNADMLRFHDAFGALNAMVGRAAATGGAHLADTFSGSGGHHICTGPFTRWVEGLIPLSLNGPGLVVPAHPNSAGANAQASFVLNAISAVPPITTTTTTTEPPTTTSSSTTTSTGVPTTTPVTTTPMTDPPTSPPALDPPAPTDPPTTPAVTDPPAATDPPTATDPPSTT